MKLANGKVILHAGDCLEVLATLAENSIDAVVTDPPYHFTSIVKRFGKEGSAPAQYGTDGAFARASRGFMGKEWDGGDIAFRPETWALVWRVLKPGAHLVAFGAPKNYHRLACAIEDAGFEIRDSLMWVFGSGFPKSLDVSKAIDKVAPRMELFAPFARHYADCRAKKGLTHSSICEVGGFYDNHNHGGASANWEKGHNVPTVSQWNVLQPLLGLSLEWLPLIERIEAEREVVGSKTTNLTPYQNIGSANESGVIDITAPATDAAREWEGWGTALKPAYEPIVLARKPLSEGTVAANVLRWGTGALNIDATRIVTDESTKRPTGSVSLGASGGWANPNTRNVIGGSDAGRWPANLCHDGSQQVLDLFPHTKSGNLHQSSVKAADKIYGGGFGNGKTNPRFFAGNEGSAARFFYCAKASKYDRAGSKHPTVKPVNLMRWLVRMVTPPGGTVLDPFAGSGTTGLAAVLEGVEAQLIEREAEYQADIQSRFND